VLVYVLAGVLLLLTLLMAATVAGPVKITMDASETRLLHMPPALFASTLRIVDASGLVSAYTTAASHLPALHTFPKATQLSETASLSSGDFVSFQYFLNKGSAVSVDWSASSAVNMLIFQGETRFNSWNEDPEMHKAMMMLLFGHLPSLAIIA